MAEKGTVKQALILGGGPIYNYPGIAALVDDKTVVICADSGYNHCKELGVTPNLLVGDFDSLKEIPEGIPRVTLPVDKNYTDSTFAVEGAIHKGCNRIIMAGMLGGRLDHTLANLQSLVYCTNQKIETFVTDGRTQVFCLSAAKNAPKTCLLKPVPGYYLSVICYSEKARGVTIEGAKYSLHNHTLTYDLARAVSNEFIGEDVTITLAEGILLVLLVPMDS